MDQSYNLTLSGSIAYLEPKEYCYQFTATDDASQAASFQVVVSWENARPYVDSVVYTGASPWEINLNSLSVVFSYTSSDVTFWDDENNFEGYHYACSEDYSFSSSVDYHYSDIIEFSINEDGGWTLEGNVHDDEKGLYCHSVGIVDDIN